jgi:hypothetical protein
VTQCCGDRPASLRKPRTGEQGHQFPPSRCSKQWPKNSQNFYNGIGKGHEHSPEQDMALVSFYLTSRGFHAWFFSPNCTKSSSEAVCKGQRSHFSLLGFHWLLEPLALQAKAYLNENISRWLLQ